MIDKSATDVNWNVVPMASGDASPKRRKHTKKISLKVYVAIFLVLLFISISSWVRYFQTHDYVSMLPHNAAGMKQGE